MPTFVALMQTYTNIHSFLSKMIKKYSMIIFLSYDKCGNIFFSLHTKLIIVLQSI